LTRLNTVAELVGPRLYHDARLVHGDLSEYNILIAPERFVTHSESVEITPVFIDFAQAVDSRHPEAHSYLARDVGQVLTFFEKQGVQVATKEDILRGIVRL
jgi:RIO kinase 1